MVIEQNIMVRCMMSHLEHLIRGEPSEYISYSVALIFISENEKPNSIVSMVAWNIYASMAMDVLFAAQAEMFSNLAL